VLANSPAFLIRRTLHILVLILVVTTMMVWLGQTFGRPRTIPIDVPLFVGHSLHIHITPGLSRYDLEPAAAHGAGIRRVPNSIPWIRVWYRNAPGTSGTLLTAFMLPAWPTSQIVVAILLAWLGLFGVPPAIRIARHGRRGERLREPAAIR
jgi:hypothetical protein